MWGERLAQRGCVPGRWDTPPAGAAATGAGAAAAFALRGETERNRLRQSSRVNPH